MRKHDGGGAEEGLGGGDGRLEVLCQPPIAAEPGEEAFDHPAACVDRETGLPLGLADDLDTDRARLGRSVAGMGGIGVAELDERPAATRGAQQGRPAVTIRYRGGWASRTKPRPSVSTIACRLRPFTFLPAS